MNKDERICVEDMLDEINNIDESSRLDIDYIRETLESLLEPIPERLSDKQHLTWICNRLVEVYGESENVDFVLRMRKIISKY